MNTKVLSILICAAAIAGSSLPARADDAPRGRAPGRDRVQERAQQPNGQPGERAERLRQMLEQRLARLREQEARIQGALDRLNSGERPDVEPWMLEPEARGPIGGGPGGDEPGLGGPQVGGEPGGPGTRPGARAVRPGGPAVGGQGGEGRPPLPRERLMDFLRENNPRMHQRLERLRQHNPEAADQALHDRQERFRELMQERAEHPEAFAVRQEAFAARERVHAAARALVMNPEDRAAMAEVRDAVEQAFDVQLKVHEMTLSRLSAELEAARERLEEQQANREQAIDSRVEEVIERAAQGGPPASPPPHRE